MTQRSERRTPPWRSAASTLLSLSLLGMGVSAPAAWASAPGLSIEAPHLQSWIGIPLGAVPRKGGGARVVRAIQAADSAYAAGEFGVALDHLQLALERLSPEAPACSVRGALRVLQSRLAEHTERKLPSSVSQDLEQGCLHASLSPQEAQAQRYLQTLTQLTQAIHSETSDLDEALDRPSKRAAAHAQAHALAEELPESAALQIRAIADIMALIHGNTDDPCEQTTLQEQRRQLQALRAPLEQASRHDLALWLTLRDLPAGGQIPATAIEPLMGLLEQPAYASMRDRALVESFIRTSMATDAQGTARDRWCEEVSLALDRRAQLTERPSQALALGQVGLIGLTRCPEPERWRAQSKAMITRAAAFDGAAFLGAVAETVLPIVFQLVMGGNPSTAAQTEAILDMLMELRDELGDSPEHQIVRATIGAAIGLWQEVFTSQEDRFASTLAEVRGDLDGAIRGGARARKGLGRELPAAHIASSLLLAGWGQVKERPDTTREALAHLERTLDRDLNRWLRDHGARAHLGALRRLSRAGEAVLADELNTRINEVLPLLQAASEPGRRETKGWRLGLEVVRALAWDALAIRVHEEHPEVAEKALMGADEILARLIPALIQDFGLEGQRWELLYVVPAVHRAILWSLLGKDSEAEFLGPADTLATAGLTSIDQAIRDAGPEEIGLLALGRDIFSALAEVGFERLAEKEVGQTLLDGLIERSDSYPPVHRAIVRAVLSSEVSNDDPDRKLALHEVPEAHRDLPDVAAFAASMDLGRAVLLSSDAPGAEPAEALRILDELWAQGERHRACGKRHPLEIVRVPRAHLLARLDRSDEALAELAAYVHDLQAGHTTGESISRCEIRNLTGTVRVNLDAQVDLLSRWHGSGNAGTFKGEFGFSTSPGTSETTTCSLEWSQGIRHEQVVNAHLFAAVLRMERGELVEAERELHQAMVSLNRIRFGKRATLGERGNDAIQAAMENLDIELLAWVSTLAGVHGLHLWSWNLQTEANLYLKNRESSWEDELGDEPPRALRGHELEDLDELVRIWMNVEQGLEPAALFAALKKAHEIAPHPDLVILYSNLVERRAPGATPFDRPDLPDRLRTSPNAQAVRLHSSLSVDSTASVPEIQEAVRPLVEAGLYNDAVMAQVNLLYHRLDRQRLDEAVEILAAMRDLIPPGEHPLTLSFVLGMILHLNPTSIEEPAWFERLTEIADPLQGSIALDLEHTVLQNLGFGLLNKREYTKARPYLQRFADLHRHVASPSNVEMLPLLTILFAIDAAEGEPDLEALQALQLIVAKEQGIDPSFGFAIQALSEACTDPIGCAELSKQILRNF